VAVDETRRPEPAVSGASVVQMQSKGLTPGAGYRVTYAIDPDLGASPVDDRLEWVDSLQTAVVSDAEASGVVAYSFADLRAGERVSVIEYANSESEREPSSAAAAYADQRHPSRVMGRPGDIRFIMTRGPLFATPSGRLEMRVVTSRAATKADALSAIRAVRQRYQAVADLDEAPTDTPRAFGLRQSLSHGASASVAGTGGVPGSGVSAARAQMRMNGISALNFDVAGNEPMPIHIRIYGNRGQLVRVLLDEAKAPGQYHLEWDRLNERGDRVPPGVYTAVMDAGDFRATRKLVVTQ
jgi:hypothetical protein